jgi:ribosomal protein S18 acetylase RimI-like enzyme
MFTSTERRFTIRAAVHDDLRSMPALHQAAFPDSLATYLGDGYLRAYYRWFVTSPESITYIAQAESGDIVGFAAGAENGKRYYAELYGERRKELMRTAFIGLLTHPQALIRLGRMFPVAKDIISRRLPGRRRTTTTNAPTSPITSGINASYISLTVLPDWRKGGIGQALTSSIIEEARRRGCPVITLSVRRDNDKAIRIWERTGWTRQSEKDHLVYYTLVLK